MASNILSLTFSMAGSIKKAKAIMRVIVTILDPANVKVQALRTALALILISRGKRAKMNLSQAITDTPTAGAYSSSGDKIAWRFRDSNGVTHTVKTPAPAPGLFLSDNETVKSTGASAAVNAWVAWFTTNCRTVAGATFPLAGYLGAHRIRL